MIGHRGKIQRFADLRCHSLLALRIRLWNRLTPGIAVGVPGVVALHRHIGIVRVAGMYMEIAKEGLFERCVVIAVRPLFRCVGNRGLPAGPGLLIQPTEPV